eukprot:5141933-Amphidinium_carterae.1
MYRQLGMLALHGCKDLVARAGRLCSTKLLAQKRPTNVKLALQKGARSSAIVEAARGAIDKHE